MSTGQVCQVGAGRVTVMSQPELLEVRYVPTTTPSGYRDYPVGEWPDPL